ncbi:TraD protein (plasmid) [Pseudomonas umsongensis]|uniref:Putative plasmid transfer protein TraD n=2 Tax=Pseudomonas TaxID=286 RepID=Q1XGN0_PSEPU|nr:MULTISPECIES: hypothetical protein [Pseudomonas]AEV45866.1 putative plasmid transfer protein TraD [Pseudomonas sp. MC1]QFG27716.1 TraD protein [Pseudomonas umsongensis]UPU95718.1 hypothetical protein M0766_29980 [Pseudomonas putida]BAE92146.1 putative plasmid transfer protein TraD [Pseudomonas putida]
MTDKDLTNALMAVGPESKAAKIRQVMPLIEQQLSAGVRRQVILDVLKEQGIELSMETLKSYLYRYRKAQRQKPAKQTKTTSPVPSMQPVIEREASENDGGVSYDTDLDSKVSQTVPLGPSELSKIMNPGDDQNATDLAMYENAGRRKRTPK